MLDRAVPDAQIIEGPQGVDSTQSISKVLMNGGADKMHDLTADFVRTLLSAIQRFTGLVIEPGHRLFCWAVRHAAYLQGHHQIGHNKVTSCPCSQDRLCQFGEKVMWKIADTSKQGNSALRWYHGIWVGIQEASRMSVVLTPEGYETARSVSRLPPSAQWTRPFFSKLFAYPGIVEKGGPRSCSRLARCRVQSRCPRPNSRIGRRPRRRTASRLPRSALFAVACSQTHMPHAAGAKDWHATSCASVAIGAISRMTTKVIWALTSWAAPSVTSSA